MGSAHDDILYYGQEEARRLRAEIERLRAAGKVLVSRAESMVITDRAGNRFQKVFVDDLNALHRALETKP